MDRTVRLLQRVMEVPGLSVAMALFLLDYHIHRNKVAQRSHTKTWMEKHKDIHLVPL